MATKHGVRAVIEWNVRLRFDHICIPPYELHYRLSKLRDEKPETMAQFKTWISIQQTKLGQGDRERGLKRFQGFTKYDKFSNKLTSST